MTHHTAATTALPSRATWRRRLLLPLACLALALASTLSVAFATSITHSYDSLDRLTRSVYSDGTVVSYSYDATGNILARSVTAGGGGGASSPTATTGAASAVTTATATVAGSVSSNGASTTVSFQYGPTTAYGSSAPAAQGVLPPAASGLAVSAAIGGLACNTTYHFRVVAANSAGTTNGTDLSFNTAACAATLPPTVQTTAASGITTTAATLGGTVSSNGSATTVSFQYGATAGYGSSVSAAQSPLPAGAVGAAVSAAIGGLACGTTYHFRVVATNATDTANGTDMSFTSAACSGDDNFPPGCQLPAGWVNSPVGADAGWAVATDSTYRGACSLKSASIGHGQAAVIGVVGNFAAGDVSFAVRVSSEQDYDFFAFYVDDELRLYGSGDIDWQPVAVPVSAGWHTLSWSYLKDEDTSVGLDVAWIDSVVLPLPPAAGLNATGLWWNPQESGWGVNFTHQGDVIFATWFTYDATGKPWWLIAVLAKSAPGVYSGPVSTVAGPLFGSVPFGPAPVETEVGTMTATFADAGHATIAYTVNGVAQTKAVVPQAFGALPNCVWGAQDNLALATNYQDLWWNSQESGWGVNFTHQGDIIFATWFTYDGQGKPWWLIALLTKSAAGVYAGPVSTVSGPPFNSVPWGAVAEVEIGSASVTFANGNAATFAYTVMGMSQSKSITRQVFAPPGTVCH